MPALLPNEPAGRVLPPVSEGEGGLKKETLSTDKATGAMEGQKFASIRGAGITITKDNVPLQGRDYFEIQAASYRERKKAEQNGSKIHDAGIKTRVSP